MNNIQMYPFERNLFFFGKLLTVRDFEAEQKYFNDKRRVLNQLMYGTGVVCGMMTTRVDGATIVMESGFALDSTGREIVVEQAVVKRLSAIDGFAAEGAGVSPVIYLCIEYAEEEREPVQGAEKGSRHSRIAEGYRLFLTYDEPEYRPVHDVGENLEKRFEGRQLERLYLAAIKLIRWETAYEIETVIPIPFGQIVPSPLYNFQAIQALQRELDELKAQLAERGG